MHTLRRTGWWSFPIILLVLSALLLVDAHNRGSVAFGTESGPDGGANKEPCKASSWHVTQSGTVTAPESVMDIINSALDILSMHLKDISATGKVEKADCCKGGEFGTLIKNGNEDYEAEVEGTLAATDAPLVIEGVPLAIGFQKAFNKFRIKGVIAVQGGIFFSTESTVKGAGGRKTSQCKEDDNCNFGSAAIEAKMSISLKCHALVDVQVNGGAVHGFNFKLEPASASGGFGGGATYNEPNCDSGFLGSIEIGAIDANLQIGPFKVYHFTISAIPYGYHHDGITFKQSPDGSWHRVTE